jgi:hypothetical protein
MIMNKDVQLFVYGSSLVSIIVAIFLFFSGKRDTGIFVGLWAPTILGFAAYYNTEVPPASPEPAKD